MASRATATQDPNGLALGTSSRHLPLYDAGLCRSSTAQEVALPSLTRHLARRAICPRCAAEAEIHFPRSLDSRAEERTVLVVYSARALGIAREPKEAIEVRAFGPEELPWDELAFWSTEQALRDLLG